MKTPYRVILFVVFCFSFNINTAFASKEKETLLPFDYTEWFTWQMFDPEGAPTIYIRDFGAAYKLDNNLALSNFLKNKYYSQTKYYPTLYMKLEKKGSKFDSYIVIVSRMIYLVNMDSDKHILSDMVLGAFKMNKSIKNTFSINENLTVTIQNEQLKYSVLQNAMIRLKKDNEQVYQVTDNGTIVKLSDKTYPSHLADYAPSNPDNCFAAVAQNSPVLFNSNENHTFTLPFTGENYQTKLSNATLDKTYPTGCYGALAHDYWVLPPVNNYSVVLFVGYDFNLGKPNNTLYLATINSERKISDVMVIYYQRDDDKQKIDFTLNQDSSIDLTMSTTDGKALKQHFIINQKGEFE